MNILIVGCGITGITRARILAEKDHQVHLIDSRNHIGGNCHDYYDDYGILVHSYGPHLFHTNNKKIFDFVNRFSNFYSYEHIAKCYVDKEYIDFPPNLNTISQLNADFIFDENKIDKTNAETYLYSTLGKIVTNKIFRKYSEKQWGIPLNQLEYKVVERVKIRNSNDSRYFYDEYQAMPANGYTKMFEEILKHKNISVELNKEFDNDMITSFDHVIYTGDISSFFNNLYHPLEYINIEFIVESFELNSFQKHPQINYTDQRAYTRTVEYKKIMKTSRSFRTSVSYEYPNKKNGIPCYPKFTSDNIFNYNRYLSLTKPSNVSFLGRLAEFKYFNMDQAIENAMNFCSKF